MDKGLGPEPGSGPACRVFDQGAGPRRVAEAACKGRDAKGHEVLLNDDCNCREYRAALPDWPFQRLAPLGSRAVGDDPGKGKSFCKVKSPVRTKYGIGPS
ncbi:hypothetical protein GCM10017322_18570 [Paracoccus aerius]|nr:hypothetical protein GCM10017322_18570 [Paracoccus aerius]